MHENISLSTEVSNSSETHRNLPFSTSQTLKEISKKSAFLMPLYIVPTLGEIIQTYLFSRFGLQSLAASELISTLQKFGIEPFLNLPDQAAVFVSEQFGKIKSQQNAQESENSYEILLSDTSQNVDNTQKAIGDIIRQAWLFGGMVSVPCMGILFLSGPLVRTFGISQEVSKIVEQFYFPVGFSIPMMMVGNINEQCLSAVNQEKWLVPYKLGMAVLNIGLNLYFIPNWGATGAGMVVIIESAARCISTTLFMALKDELKPFKLLEFGHRSNYYLSPLFWQGLPTATSLFVFRSVSFATSIFLGNLGDLRLSIEQTASRVLWLPMMLSYGVSQAVNRLIGQSLGERNFQQIKQYGNLGLITSTLLYSTVALGCNFFALPIASLFMEPEIIADNEEMIRYSFIILSFVKLFGVMLDSTGLSLAGIEDTLLPSLINLLTTLSIILPLSALSAFVLDFDIYGINSSIALGFLAAAVPITGYWFKLSRQIANDEDFEPTVQSSNAKISELLSKFSFFKTSPTRFDSTEEMESLSLV